MFRYSYITENIVYFRNSLFLTTNLIIEALRSIKILCSIQPFHFIHLGESFTTPITHPKPESVSINSWLKRAAHAIPVEAYRCSRCSPIFFFCFGHEHIGRDLRFCTRLCAHTYTHSSAGRAHYRVRFLYARCCLSFFFSSLFLRGFFCGRLLRDTVCRRFALR